MPSDSLYLLCRHDNLMNGFLCRECLDEGIGGQGLCEHRNAWQSCDLCQHSKAWLLQRLCLWQREREECQGKFLAFAMAAHPRLGSLADPPTIYTDTTTETTGKAVVVTTRTVMEHRHCAFARMPADVLRKIWEVYQRPAPTAEPFAVDADGVVRQVC